MGDIHGFGHIDPSARVLDPHLSIFLKAEMIRVGAFSRIDGLVRLHGGVGLTIGEHVHIASHSTINTGNGETIMEDHCGCSNGVVIASGGPDFAHEHICAADSPEHQHVIRKQTVIGKHVFIGPNAVIMPGVLIDRCALVLAGAVVTRNVLSYDVVAGVPARVVGRRVERPDGKLEIEWFQEPSVLARKELAGSIERHLLGVLERASA